MAQFIDKSYNAPTLNRLDPNMLQAIGQSGILGGGLKALRENELAQQARAEKAKKEAMDAYSASPEVQAALQSGDLEQLKGINLAQLNPEYQQALGTRVKIADTLAAQAARDRGLKVQEEEVALKSGKDAREQFTQQALADIYSQPTAEKQRAKLAEYRQAGGFSPEQSTLADLRKAWEPVVDKYIQPTYYKTNPDGSYSEVKPRSVAEEESFLKQGYTRGNLKNTEDKNGSGSSKTARLNLFKAVGNLGNNSSAYKAVMAADKAGVPIEAINETLAAQGLYSPDTAIYDLGGKDIDVSELIKITSTYLEEARKKQEGLGETLTPKVSPKVPPKTTREPWTLKSILNNARTFNPEEY